MYGCEVDPLFPALEVYPWCTLVTEAVLAAGLTISAPIYLLLSHTLYRLCKVGLGSLGVVTELTLKCIPRFDLCEKTAAATRETIAGTWSVHVLHFLPFRHDTNSPFTFHPPCATSTGTGNAEHARRLQAFRHVRYMWIPYTDTVMHVTSNPVPVPQAGAADGGGVGAAAASAAAAAAREGGLGAEAEDKRSVGKSTQALCDLLLRLQPSRVTAEVHKVHLMCGYI